MRWCKIEREKGQTKLWVLDDENGSGFGWVFLCSVVVKDLKDFG
jgi:hypothetical protein